ncbi:hypothetical protein I305_05016 [Cryptococcus gattii E566]|uniref:Exoribonuclease phosphorolytic domain-containing protein n=2 Tax=Cryptococcus gattii TaxID=37769 RepID=E6RC14_CRYGW|nr:exosome non-catalytic core subunit RRP46 [Cryptococcus gattii WM276]ADV24392.1 conserved hypothetical protein [Cryptococcus gattii WM276]KIR76353.1 hypothetical protein I306_06688 [Cryptococcus gattii EJB2]KIY32448.1 hypothetical protein I305_05016 [Cryptococcus gattii E566]KJE02554.1 hypothetical protein I311_03742 [Cryptococcus gattii NT-10]
MATAGPSRRPDGRTPAQLRPLHLSIGELDRADGSARFAFGSNAVLASCSGPIEVRLREELPDKATFEVNHRPLEGVGATPSRALVTTLETIFPPVLSLEKHPRSLVQLVVQSLMPSTCRAVYGSVIGTEGVGAEQNTWPATDNDEYAYVPESKRDAARISPAAGYTFTARAASINASTLALLSAGTISILALPVAVALVVTTEGSMMLDPEADEEKQAKARFGFGWAWGAIFGTASEGNSMEVAGQSEGGAELVWVESEGNFTRQEWSEALEMSKTATKAILEFIRIQLDAHLSSRQLS